MVDRISRLRVATTVQAVLLYAACMAWPQLAQSQTVQIIKPPKTQLWMDVATGSKSELGLTLWNSKRPDAPMRMEIPAGMLMGESLTLLPPKPETKVDLETHNKTSNGESFLPNVIPKVPKGRLLLYWGCSATVQNGQPRVIDFSKPDSASMPAFTAALKGSYVPESDDNIKPGSVVFPYEKGQKNLPTGASLVGVHRLKGEGISPTFAFNLASGQDVMPAIDLRRKGTVQDGASLSWPIVTGARAYFLHATAQKGDDTILWSSSELPDAGTAIFNYLSNETLDRWVNDRLLLDAGASQCAIPKGILVGQGAVLHMMAFGGEHSLAFPARPAYSKLAWEPEWAVRLRLQSQITTVLSESVPASAPTKDRDMLPPDPSILLRDPTNIFRGILGR